MNPAGHLKSLVATAATASPLPAEPAPAADAAPPPTAGATARRGGIAGLRLGRISEVPQNDRPFGAEPEQIARHWCQRHAIPYLGLADVGHDIDNKIVPFGLARRAASQ